MDERRVGKAVAALFVAAGVTGCGSAVMAATTSPSAGTPTAAASSTAVSQPVASRPAYVVAHLRVTATVDGNIYLAPPPAATPARVSAAKAFRLARHRWGNPEGSKTPKLVLTRYTNDGQGTIGSDNSLERWYVDRLAWAVIDYGGTCQVSGNAPVPSGSPPPTPVFSHACLTISFVDALTGADLGSMDEFGGGTRDVSTG